MRSLSSRASISCRRRSKPASIASALAISACARDRPSAKVATSRSARACSPVSSASFASSSAASLACPASSASSASTPTPAALRGRRVRCLRRSLGLVADEDDPPRELEPLVRRLVELQILELAPVRDVALGLRGLSLERAEAPLYFAHDVPDAQKVLLRELH